MDTVAVLADAVCRLRNEGWPRAEIVKAMREAATKLDGLDSIEAEVFGRWRPWGA
jgi:hypothetical protein